MKKFFFYNSILIFFVFLILLIFLSTIGIETNKFNKILEKKISSNITNVQVNLDKIKLKLNLKNLSFFVTTKKPKIQFYNNPIQIKKIDAYLAFRSFLTGSPKLDKIYVSSGDTDVKELKKVIKYLKPSNIKKFFLNETKEGKLNFNLDLDLIDNEINSYEVSGYVKNLVANIQNIQIKGTSFIYVLNKQKGEINNLRGSINDIVISSGSIKYENSKILNVSGELNSEALLTKKDLAKIFQKTKFKNIKNVNVQGSLKKIFEINLDETLKVIDYNFNLTGNIKNSEISFQKPLKLNILKNEIKNLLFEKTEFKVNFDKKGKKNLNFNGLYKANNKSLQKFNFKNDISNTQKIYIDGDTDNELIFPLINYDTKNQITNIKSDFEIGKNSIKVNDLLLKEGKSEIFLNNLLIKDKKLSRFNMIKVKTFNKDDELNNDFMIDFSEKLKIYGSKYDASNLTNAFDNNKSNNFFNNLNTDISIKIEEINSKVSNQLSNFNLVGSISKGKFDKIVSKGEFDQNKYLEISLREDKVSKMKILEVYSDLPKPLLSNYKFFDGLSGGNLLLNSYYNSQISNSQLVIENFRVKNAPNFVKLLSLADFGGMADALSGEGLSFERLEMKMEKNKKVLNLKELYAIGPSISILMEGYVESDTGLVSLRGTMVPAKTLNKFLSKVPIVGDILIPKEIGEGLFGISFKMKGLPGKIKTSVNPIKTLTPRFIQKALKKTK